MLRPSAVLSESKHGLQPMTMSSVSFYKVERNFWVFFYDQNFFFVFFFHVVLHIEKKTSCLYQKVSIGMLLLHCLIYSQQ